MQVVVTFDLDTKDEDYHSEDYAAAYDLLEGLGLTHWKDSSKTERKASTTCSGKMDLAKLRLADDCTAKQIYAEVKRQLRGKKIPVKRLYVGIIKDGCRNFA